MRRHPFLRVVLLAFGLAGALLFSGCDNQVKLYSQLDEDQANLMMALLIRMGIPCEKVPASENQFSLTVHQEDFPTAVNLLNYFGYPMKDSQLTADLLKSQGIISSPAAEANRQTLAQADELALTISRINGVLAAKVFLSYGTTEDPNSWNASSASVFIKYREGFPMEKEIPKIKDLVYNCVLGLDLSNIAVVTFPSREWEYTDATGIVGFTPKPPPSPWADWAWPAALLGLGALAFGAVAGRRYLTPQPPPAPAHKA